jgi:hypothetical protein
MMSRRKNCFFNVDVGRDKPWQDKEDPEDAGEWIGGEGTRNGKEETRCNCQLV